MAAERAAATASARARSTSRSTEGAKNESLGSASGGRPASSTAARYASSTPAGAVAPWQVERFSLSLIAVHHLAGAGNARAHAERALALSLKLGYDCVLGIGRADDHKAGAHVERLARLVGREARGAEM